jgi:Mg-chelatase subunit ChlI
MASRVSLIRGEDRRQNILAALDAIAADVEPLLQVRGDPGQAQSRLCR